jgi:NAD(P)-dependent dehydrogenase (short-subunit alcohol dehydrogenase family)
MSSGSQFVLITGAAGAIGRATVERFIAANFTVIGFDRDPAVTAMNNGVFLPVQLDVGDSAALEDAMQKFRKGGTLRHVISIAGGALPEEPVQQHDPALLDPKTFESSIRNNLTTHFLLLHAVLPWLREGGDSDRSLTFTSSFNALSGWGMPAYSAAKAGLLGMMNALVAPLGACNIRTNVVAPGTIRTPRTERIWQHDPQHFESLERTSALARLGKPQDVADAFFAIATILTHVTGQVLVVDGGQMVKRCA